MKQQGNVSYGAGRVGAVAASDKVNVASDRRATGAGNL